MACISCVVIYFIKLETSTKEIFMPPMPTETQNCPGLKEEADLDKGDQKAWLWKAADVGAWWGLEGTALLLVDSFQLATANARY